MDKDHYLYKLLILICFLGLTFSFIYTPFVHADDLDEINEDISEKEQTLLEKEASIEKSKKSELDIKLEKLPYDQQLKLVEEEISKLQNGINVLEKEIGSNEEEVKIKTAEIQQIEELRNRQLLAVYINSRTRTLAVLFSGNTPVEIMRDLIFRNVVVKAFTADLRDTQKKFAELDKQKLELEEQRQTIAQQKQELDKQKADLDVIIAEIQSKLNSQYAVQANLRNEMLALESEISGLSAAAAEIIASKSGGADSGGGAPGNGGGSQPPATSAGKFDVYNNGKLVYAGLNAPIELKPESGVRFSVDTRMYRGDVIFRNDTNVNFINRLPVQDYIKGIGEMPSSWHLEALKVQAVSARTYAYANWNKRIQYNYNLLDNTNDQNYVGFGKEVASYGTRWVSAVDQTNQEIIKKDGGIITAWYHSTCGGHTISSQEKWGGYRSWAIGKSDRYMVGTSVYGYDQASPYYDKKWGNSNVDTSTFIDLVNAAIYLQLYGTSEANQNKLIKGQPTYLNPSQLQSALGLNSVQARIGTISSASVVYDDGGSSISLNSKHTNLAVVNGSGSISIPASYVKLAYNLRSPGTNYVASSLWHIKLEGGSWNFYSMGWGHRVGMCQYGANGRANAGQIYTTMVPHYFNGSQVVNQNPPASLILIGITQSGGASTTLSRDGVFGIYSGGVKVLEGNAGQTWRFVRK